MATNNYSSNGTKIARYIGILIVTAIIGCGIGDNCQICGDYVYKEYIESTYSDYEISEMVGRDKVEEYKKKLKDNPASIYVLKLEYSETLENGNLRGTANIGIQTKSYGDVIYKGKFLTVSDADDFDGLIRISYRYDDFKEEFEQITFNEKHNILTYNKIDSGLVVSNLNSAEFGLTSLENAFFKAD